MRLHTWLKTCSSSNCINTSCHEPTVLFSHKDHLASETCNSSDAPSSSSVTPSYNNSTDSGYGSSLQSHLSIQTHPSVPSLQTFSLETLNLSVGQQHVTSLRPHPCLPITCVAVHDSLLYAASSNDINVYDQKTCTIVDVLKVHDSSSGSVKAVVFYDRYIFTAHQDCKIRVWHNTIATKRHKILTTLPTLNDRLCRLVLPKNYVTIRRHKKCLWIEHADAVTGLAVCNGSIYSVSWDRCLKIWRCSDFRCVESVRAHEDAINTVVVSNDGTVYTGSADRRIRVWAKLYGGKQHSLVATLEKHKSAVNALALNDDGTILFSGACDRSILVWEREDSANHMVVSGALRGHGKAVLCLTNVSDLLFSGSADKTIRTWRRGSDGKYCCLNVLEGHQRPVKSLTVVKECLQQIEGETFPNNRVISVFSGSLDGEIKVWKVLIRNLNKPVTWDENSLGQI